jgi:hypothetical protein
MGDEKHFRKKLDVKRFYEKLDEYTRILILLEAGFCGARGFLVRFVRFIESSRNNNCTLHFFPFALDIFVLKKTNRIHPPRSKPWCDGRI